MTKGLLFGILLSMINACQSAERSQEMGGDMSRLKADGIAVINWPCSGTGKEFPPGSNSQEEYCEWTRSPEPYVGRGAKPNGEMEAINLPKACIFTTSFDQSRSFFLTKRTVGTDLRQPNPYHETFANSYAFLVGGTEPDSLIPRKGIIGHCIEGNSCDGGNCVANRASDPQICRALNNLGSRGCKVDLDFQVAPVINSSKVPLNRHGDQVVKPQLTMRSEISGSCWYVEDPKLTRGVANAKGQRFDPRQQATLIACDAEALKIDNCDQLSADITTGVTIKIGNPSCVGGVDQPVPGVGIRTGAKCKLKAASMARSEAKTDSVPRFTVDTLSDFLIRGFLGDFASITITHEGKVFGAGSGTPTFVDRNSINPDSCVIP
ncbi:MAG: hypothetical protein WCI18_16065 [Pseudomonadota bacterium]